MNRNKGFDPILVADIVLPNNQILKSILFNLPLHLTTNFGRKLQSELLNTNFAQSRDSYKLDKLSEPVSNKLEFCSNKGKIRKKFLY